MSEDDEICDVSLRGRIKYVVGDATAPVGPGRKFIVHGCNNIGGWGSGFVLSVSARWPEPEEAYRNWCSAGRSANGIPFRLGEIQLVNVGPDLAVVNMITQNGVYSERNRKPIDYEAVYDCLVNLTEKAGYYGASVHAPRFGAGLAQGRWGVIESLIEGTLMRAGIPVTIYDPA